VGVTPNVIERYDTYEDEDMWGSSGDEEEGKGGEPGSGAIGGEEPKFWEKIHITKDRVNNAGNLISFPLTDPYLRETGDILITGGLLVGLTNVIHQSFNVHANKPSNCDALSIPIPDISKFYFHAPDNRVYVLGRYKVQAFDLITKKWEVAGPGYIQFVEPSWNF